MMKNIIFLFILFLLFSCNKGNNITENKLFIEQIPEINIENWDFYEYSYDGRKLFSDLNTIDWNNQISEDNTKLLSFILNDEPKNINFIINGNRKMGNVTKINIFSEYGDSFDKHGIEHLRYYSVNYLEIEYEDEKLDKEILKFRIYDFIHYMDNKNLILRISTKLLNDIERIHNYFNGIYIGIIDIDFDKNIIKIIVEYVPNNYGVLF